LVVSFFCFFVGWGLGFILALEGLGREGLGLFMYLLYGLEYLVGDDCVVVVQVVFSGGFYVYAILL
jgi:hypothetical protein